MLRKPALVVVLVLATAWPLSLPLAGAHNGVSGYEFVLCGPFNATGTCDLGTHIVISGWGGNGLICCGYRGTIALRLDTIVQGGTPLDGTVLASYASACTITDTTEHCVTSGVAPPQRGASVHAWCTDNSTAGLWGCYFDHA